MQFPFPEEDKGSGATVDADASGESKDTSSSSSSADPTDDAADAAGDVDSDSKTGDGAADSSAVKDKGSEGTSGRHLLHRVNPVATKLQSPEEREAEDLSIAHYYSQTGDFAGAYLRSQDAVKTLPDDPDAHFALAEAALKLSKREQAIAEYNACLKLDPPDKQAKAARKALARLTP
jgi:tetratricopeptide (TPR) repeat protein